MRKITAVTLIATLAILAGCGGDSHEGLADEAVVLMNDVGTILDGVKDQASADAAADKIDALAARAQDLSKRQKALPKMTEAEAKALQTKMESAMKAMGDMQVKAVKAAPHIATSKKLQDALEKFGKAMN